MPFRAREKFIESNDLRVSYISTEHFETMDFVIDCSAG